MKNTFNNLEFSEDNSIDFDPTLETSTEEVNNEEVENQENTEQEEDEDYFSVDYDPTKDTQTSSEKEEEEDENADPQGNNSAVSTNAPLKEFVMALKEGGQLSLEEDDIKGVKSFEDLGTLIQKEVEKREFADLNEKQKEFVELLREGVPSDYLQRQFAAESRLEQVEEEDIRENPELQTSLYMANLKAKGFTPEKAQRYYDKIKDDPQLLTEESIDALQEIKDRAIEERNKVVESIKKERQKLEGFVKNVKEIIPGVPLSKVEKDNIIKSINTIETDKDGKRVDPVVKKKSENPEAFVARLHYFLQLGLFDEGADLSKLTKKVKSKAAEEFERKLNTNSYESFGKGSNRKPEDYGAASDLLNAIEQIF